MEVRLTARTIEIFSRSQRVAVHQRSHQPGGFTTDPAHRPKSHQSHLEWTPTRLISWAQNEVGPQCAAAVTYILEHKPHPEMGYRSCLGLIRLNREHGRTRLEQACQRARWLDVCSYRSIKSILDAKLETQPGSIATSRRHCPCHARQLAWRAVLPVTQPQPKGETACCMNPPKPNSTR